MLLTGATGFLGPAMAHELLARGRRVLCLVRAETPSAARARLRAALRPWLQDFDHLLETGRLAVLRGDVCSPDAGVAPPVRAALRGRVCAVVHAAGSTRFSENAAGDPRRTNVAGTRNVFALARAIDCRSWHLISTAFVAGAADEAMETIDAAPPAFRNAYESSKWCGEQVALAAACDAGSTLTIYRPSIVVGHSETGRAGRFSGIYYLFRATSLVAKAADQQPDADRHQISLHIPALSDGRPNLICIDDVAAAFGELFVNREAHGGVYHLTHPEPPTNAQIKRVLEAHYDIGGGRFRSGGASASNSKSDEAENGSVFQSVFNDMIGSVQDYLFDAPRFDRSQVARFLSRRPAAWDEDRLRRLVAAAEAAGWRSNHTLRDAIGDPRDIAAYFTEYLPRQIADSMLGRATQLALNVRFEIGKRSAGRWWCRFRDGRVMSAEPANGQPTDVVYRTNESRFWAAVAGEMSGAELFLSGDAEIEGDIERALKFATALEAFVREHPYQRTVDGRAVREPAAIER